MPCFIEDNQAEFKINELWMQSTIESMLSAAEITGFSVNIRLTDDAEIQKFNKKFRKKDKPTDILSFPAFPNLTPGETPKSASAEEFELGDIIISLQATQKDADAQSITLQERLQILLAHGIAHLLGYTHKTDDEFAQMQDFEKKLLQTE